MNDSDNHDQIRSGAEILSRGGLVAFPTETVYGLGADARNHSAVARIYTTKGRPSNNPLIVHVSCLDEILRYSSINKAWNPKLVTHWIERLAPLWPGPLSVILPKGPEIAPNVCAGGPSVALRIPKHPTALALIRAFNGPIAAPSANRSMYISPTTATHVRQGLHEDVDLIIDGGDCPIGIESTVLSLLQQTPKVLRPGAITVDQIQSALGTKVDGPAPQILPSYNAQATGGSLLSPGLLAKHYSPLTPLRLRTSIASDETLPPRVGVLIFSDWQPHFKSTITKELDHSSHLEHVAAGLFKALRELDAANLDLIVVDVCEPIGLGEAIMDRLIRASSPAKH